MNPLIGNDAGGDMAFINDATITVVRILQPENHDSLSQ